MIEITDVGVGRDGDFGIEYLLRRQRSPHRRDRPCEIVGGAQQTFNGTYHRHKVGEVVKGEPTPYRLGIGAGQQVSQAAPTSDL